MITEKIMEDLIAANPELYIGESGLELIARQFVVPGYRFDLIFRDRTGAKLIVEIQKGTLDRSHTYKILDYYDAFKEQNPHEFVEVMIIANLIPAERKQRLASKGIAYREIPVVDFLTRLESEPAILQKQGTLNSSVTAKVAPSANNETDDRHLLFELFKDQQMRFKTALCEYDPSIWFPRLRGKFEETVPSNWFICFVPGSWGRWRLNNYGVHFDFKYAIKDKQFRLMIGVETPLREEFRQSFKEDVISQVNAKRITQAGFTLQASERKKLLEADLIPLSDKAWELAFDRYRAIQPVTSVIADIVKEYSRIGRFDTSIEF